MNENLRPQDFLGKIIQLHDHVVYPTRRGSALWLSQGTVQDTNYHDDLSREHAARNSSSAFCATLAKRL